MIMEVIKPSSSAPTSEEIARRAYEIYVKEGRPEGREQQHWLKAEKELIAERQQKAVVVARPAPVAQPDVTVRQPVAVVPPVVKAQPPVVKVEPPVAVESPSSKKSRPVSKKATR